MRHLCRRGVLSAEVPEAIFKPV
jgi:hypothetical protein